MKSFGFVVSALLLCTPRIALSDTTHVVGRGHTLAAIAARYKVSVKAILEANHLTNPKSLRVGETLVIPGVTPPKSKNGKEVDKKDVKDAAGKKKARPVTYAARAKTPGIVHVARVATNEDFTVRVREHGAVPKSAQKIFERMMRSTNGQAHPVEPRLLALLGNVSDHFGSRKIEVVSGYRPYRSTQYTKHSNHNVGKAIDFRVLGVPNEVLRDYCRSLKNVGVGYYPNSVFVHMDARLAPTFWIDYSKPGEPPRYNSPDVDADEGASDVTEEHDHASDVPTGTETSGSDTLANTANAAAPAAANSAGNEAPSVAAAQEHDTAHSDGGTGH